MNIKNRLRKLESDSLKKQDCLCGKTFVDLFYKAPGFSNLSPCPKCKEQYDFWANISAEAKNLTENLTDV